MHLCCLGYNKKKGDDAFWDIIKRRGMLVHLNTGVLASSNQSSSAFLLRLLTKKGE